MKIVRETGSRFVDFDAANGLVQHAGFRECARLTPHDPARMERLLTRADV